ncbi:hypothetical protein RHSIM_Rhsim01G0276400 [Rhododendron simsii]|uniref:DUF4283 domain-containing protein n=1 Tax=Rhododendron simsii TaxID=118357 RepID=A0A834HFF5_RHOSS|nr:hypothetical protein RHSIM_Rhsim01G0276400 [Rhododendron simsii]
MPLIHLKANTNTTPCPEDSSLVVLNFKVAHPEPGGVEKGSSWRDKVAPLGVTKSRMQLRYFPPVVDGERVRVSPPSVVELQGVEKWKDCLVGHFVDKKIPFLTIKSIAFRRWANYGLVDVLSNEKGFYFFQFGSAEVCRQIVETGPWHFGSRLMVLQIWNADIDYEKEVLAKLPMWIQLYSVPLQVWTAAGLSYIASSVGKHLYADEMTETAKRISYAKICVEVDVVSLPHSVDLLTASGKTVSIAIKYPWRPAKCVSCNVFGHSEMQATVVAEVIIDSEVLVNKEAMVIANVVTVSNSSKDIRESSLYAALPNELGIVESKIRQENLAVSIKKSQPAGWDYVHNIGTGSVARIIVAWDTQVGSRRQLWDDLRSGIGSVGGQPWIVVGDFNVVRWQHEKSNPHHFDTIATGDFNKYMEDIEMEDLNSKGLRFTWSNKQAGAGHCSCRLDRALVNSYWQNVFTESQVAVLVSGASDHSLLLSWNCPMDKVGSPTFILYEKLRRLKPCLRNFNGEYYSDIQNSVLVAKEELSSIQNRCA